MTETQIVALVLFICAGYLFFRRPAPAAAQSSQRGAARFRGLHRAALGPPVDTVAEKIEPPPGVIEIGPQERDSAFAALIMLRDGLTARGLKPDEVQKLTDPIAPIILRPRGNHAAT